MKKVFGLLANPTFWFCIFIAGINSAAFAYCILVGKIDLLTKDAEIRRAKVIDLDDIKSALSRDPFITNVMNTSIIALVMAVAMMISRIAHHLNKT